MTSLRKEGKRVYFVGAPFSAKDVLKQNGCRWDPDAKQWWTGSAEKAAELLVIVNNGNGNGNADADANAGNGNGNGNGNDAGASIDRNAAVIIGSAKYKGRTYRLLFYGETKRGLGAKLAFRDGSKVFWADGNAVEVTKRYRSKQSIVGLERFAAEARDGTSGACAECGYVGHLTECSDSSGVVAGCCGRCARMSAFERSFG